MSQLTVTEGLGSQMWSFAAMYAITRKTKHRILFLDSWTEGKGLRLNIPFDDMPIEVVSVESMSDEERVALKFDIDTSKVVDSRVFEIDTNTNYDFRGGLFLSYRYWYPIREELFKLFRFKAEIVDQAKAVLAQVDRNGREVVSLHVRRGDYLGSHYAVNLTMDYYASACSLFDDDRHAFLVFSDDLDWCRREFSRRKNFFYAGQNAEHVDLCAMSLCDHHIVANSHFSSWGALLNKSRTKKVVCPTKYFMRDDTFFYINNGWFPDEWISLDDLMA